MLKRFFLLFFLLATACLRGESTYLYMSGYLGRDLVTALELELNRGKKTDEGNILIELDSSSGDIEEVIRLAHGIYDLKIRNNKFVTVFIRGKAVGPAAIIPFLADELIVTPLVAWGDIPYGVGESKKASSILSAVSSLIEKNRTRAPTFELLAHAMVDPHYKLVYGDGEARVKREDSQGFDPLILNRKGMESLDLVDQVLTDEEFHKSYEPRSKELLRIKKMVPTKDLDKELKKYISYSDTEQNLIGYLHIGNERPIDEAAYIYIKFAIEDFIRNKVRFVVLNLDTPGGEVLSALKISDLLQKLDVQHHIPVVAFLDNWAVSAGAMLAYSCRFIGIQQGSLMGAAEPVILGGGGETISASEKVNSALRAEFANLSSFYGRNPLIAEAMVDKDVILVIRDHKVIQLRSEEDIITNGADPDIMISGRGKLLTLNAKQLIDYGVADFEVAETSLPGVTQEELRNGVWPAKKMPVFQQPYFAKIPHAMMIDYHDWRVGLFTVLSHPVVSSLLFIGLVVGLYIEINTPGFGVPGSIGIGCLALILLSSFSSQAMNWIEVIILAAGLMLLALELFVIPGFGITGILGILLTIIGLFALMLPGLEELSLFNPETFYLVGADFMERLAWLSGSLIFAIAVIILMARFFSDRYFRFSKLILKGEQEKEAGFVSGIPRELMPNEGDLGETVTPLRPSGKVHIGENLFDAITQGGFLDSHCAIEVIRIEGSKVVVRRFEERE